MTEVKKHDGDLSTMIVFWIAVIILGGLALSKIEAQPPVKPIPACYDTGDVQVVSVHNSGIQSAIEYQHEVQCNNGESYWRSK